MVRLSTQRPERQNPLHRAYARVPQGPAPYNNQASAAAQSQPGGVYKDDASKSADGGDKPLPSEPVGRPSFAIEDEEDEDEGDIGATAGKASANGNGASNKAARVLGENAPEQPASNSNGFNSSPSYSSSAPTFSGGEPPEPVIALRPIEEQTAEEAAAEFGAPVVRRYEGLMDCLNKMVDEEGVESLGRGAWVTLLAMFAGSFS